MEKTHVPTETQKIVFVAVGSREKDWTRTHTRHTAVRRVHFILTKTTNERN